MHACPRRLLLLLILALIGSLTASQSRAEFPLKDGDVWVMAGDSITAQHLHSNYFEAFCFARYPQLKFAFRNSGVGGHTIPSTLARFDYDVAAWKPTVVSVELGMNDQGGTPTDKFVANMKTMVDRIRADLARPVIFSASPINNGDTLAKLGGNQRLNDYARGAEGILRPARSIPYADQFHALIDVWGKNKSREAWPMRRERSSNSPRTTRSRASNTCVHSWPPWTEAPTNRSRCRATRSTPAPPGQLMMAAALLRELGADGFVSSATIDAAGKVAEAKGCQLDGVSAAEGTLAFDRLDERLPMPIPDDARAVLPMYPTILDLSQYTLKVTGLKDGKYTLQIDGVPIATLSAKESARAST